MKKAGDFIIKSLVGGLLVLAPAYLALLLLLKAAKSLAGIVRPVAALLPDWFPGEMVVALLLILVVCFAVGAVIRTPWGRSVRGMAEETLFRRIPGYALIRSFVNQLAGTSEGEAWKPVMAEIEDALVPGFIIEQHDDGRYTVFVPSVPTPLAGALYILARQRVHLLDVPFTRAISTITRWGTGSRELVAAMMPQEQEKGG